jgi:hypothetical protein
MPLLSQEPASSQSFPDLGIPKMSQCLGPLVLQAPFRSGVSIESCSIPLVRAIKMASLLIAG